MSLQWVVVGGGVHGIAIARALLEEGGVDPALLRVVDEHARPAAVWRRRARATGMRYLRSPSVHHLDRRGDALFRLAERVRLTDAPFRGRYHRPSLELFDAHVEDVSRRTGLGDVWIRGRVDGLVKTTGGWRVRLGAREVDARRVVLALGFGGDPVWPAWARAARRAGSDVTHVFDARFEGESVRGREVAVIGGGITAFHVARAEASRGAKRVTIVHPAPIHVAEFDVDPGWLGPRLLPAFDACDTPGARHAVIDSARRMGSVPRRVVELARREPAITTWWATVAEASPSGGGLELISAVGTRRVDRVVLATGFRSGKPGGAWAAVAGAKLPTSPRGYPVPAASLEWGAGLFVAGALAELTLGPAARNIWGARAAARRIAGA